MEYEVKNITADDRRLKQNSGDIIIKPNEKVIIGYEIEEVGVWKVRPIKTKKEKKIDMKDKIIKQTIKEDEE